ncbi:MAG TPA: hypothetical protein VGN18_00265 [Jatrophihabitans sp.]|jgi:hypothetical protein|uniref:hypothetical protein n=1 Tax=Jatrophihabitans sp. TaxID=1932789 RepID=UPI002E05C35D|nr:hypothetical protein [Jatrophihabitans sp.]
MDAALHRIEVLPGSGRYAVTFVGVDGLEQTAVAEIADDTLVVAESSLPAGWTTSSERFLAAAETVFAFERARSVGSSGLTLRDVDGGWDVTLGNVTLDASGGPTCAEHGNMKEEDSVWVCAGCGARATLG